MSESRMSERSETESERDLDGIDVVSEPDASSKRSSLRSGGGAGIIGGDSSPAPHQVLLAAAYLDDACTGSHMEFQPTVSAVRLYTTYKNKWFTGILYSVLAIILGLAIFEKPEADPIKQYLPIPFVVTVSIEILCIAFLLFRLAQEFLFSVRGQFWRDAKHLTLLTILLLTFIDIAIYTGLEESGISSVRWSRPLRPLLLVNIPEGRQIRRAFRNIRRTLPGVTSVLVLFLLVLFLFAMMFYKLFSNKGMRKIDGQRYFYTFGDTYWDLYVLVTTANNPDIMMPAYNQLALYSIFFIVFEIVCLYIFMSIFLAVVYNNYKSNLKREVKEAIERKNELIDKAFDLMKSDVFGREVIIQEDFNKLLKRMMRSKSDQYFKIIWLVLDVDNTGYIDRREFHNLPDLLNIKVTEVKPNLFQRFIPKIYNSNYSKKVILTVKSKYFRYIFDCIIIINALVILTTHVEYVEWIFLSVFILEILLKMYAFGFYMFFGKLWNVFDFFIIGSALILDIIDEARGDSEDANVILDILLILRVMRGVKILHSLNYFKSILNTILHILPSLITYASVLFVFIYIFAIIGMECFKGRINFYGENTYKPDELNSTMKYCGVSGTSRDGLPDFKNSTFYKLQYCANNFNDFGSAFIVLFELLVVNQWHVLTEGFVIATGTKATRIFFIAFHIVSVLNILNIFTAFVIEAFLLEFNLAKGTLETALETKINEMGLAYGSKPLKKKVKKTEVQEENILDDQDEYDGEDADADHDNLQFVRSQLEEIVANYTNYSRETPIRFHLKKGGTTNVHTLLQKMFQQELVAEKARAGPGEGMEGQFDSFT